MHFNSYCLLFLTVSFLKCISEQSTPVFKPHLPPTILRVIIKHKPLISPSSSIIYHSSMRTFYKLSLINSDHFWLCIFCSLCWKDPWSLNDWLIILDLSQHVIPSGKPSLQQLDWPFTTPPWQLFLFFCFLGLYPWHVEVPVGTTAAGLHLSHSNTRSLTHWARPRIKPTTSWFLVGFISAAPQRELHTSMTSESHISITLCQYPLFHTLPLHYIVGSRQPAFHFSFFQVLHSPKLIVIQSVPHASEETSQGHTVHKKQSWPSSDLQPPAHSIVSHGI